MAGGMSIMIELVPSRYRELIKDMTFMAHTLRGIDNWTNISLRICVGAVNLLVMYVNHK
jgi:hypothetical protein